jgi:hypothetical protein
VLLIVRCLQARTAGLPIVLVLGVSSSPACLLQLLPNALLRRVSLLSLALPPARQQLVQVYRWGCKSLFVCMQVLPALLYALCLCAFSTSRQPSCRQQSWLLLRRTANKRSRDCIYLEVILNDLAPHHCCCALHITNVPAAVQAAAAD